jgi:hypothetical protein
VSVAGEELPEVGVRSALPPSTARSVPVMYEPSPLARNLAAPEEVSAADLPQAHEVRAMQVNLLVLVTCSQQLLAIFEPRPTRPAGECVEY